MSVRRGLGDEIGDDRDIPAAIVDDDRLLQRFRQALCDDAGNEIGPAARLCRNDTHRLGRERLCTDAAERDSAHHHAAHPGAATPHWPTRIPAARA